MWPQSSDPPQICLSTHPRELAIRHLRTVVSPQLHAIIAMMTGPRPDPSPARLRRATCARCQHPLPTCLCDLAVPTPHRTEVLVLQHPLEQGEAKNSVTLLRLSLAHCRVVVGDRFDDATLCALLRPPGRQVRLLYPDVPAVPAPPAPALNPAEPLRLLVIDATWRKSLRMLLEHPLLAALPRLTLTTPEPTRYRPLRAARNPEQLSTLEATVHALATLEGAAFAGTPLLEAFGRFVEREVARRREHNRTDPRPIA